MSVPLPGDVRETLMVLKPRPSPVPLLRLGGDRDGAYLVPDDLVGVAACFSPGVNNVKSFEDDLAAGHGIASHMCDFTSDEHSLSTPLIRGLQTFEKKWLDVDGSPDSLTLAEWVARWSPDANDDLILQMDIEGAEYRNLSSLSRSILQRFRIIVMELHGLDAAMGPDTFEERLGPLLRMLGQDFICVHAHPNNCCGEFVLQGTNMNVPNLIEVTFLRRDRFTRGSQTWTSPSFPHPLDIARNVDHLPPLFLNEAWSDGVISDASKAKILADTQDYARGLESRYAEERATLANVHTLLQSTTSPPGSLITPVAEVQALEVARGKPFSLSSAYSGYAIGGFVAPAAPFFFHTDFGVNERITIDLQSTFAITKIVLANRTDLAHERARWLLYCLHSLPDVDFGLVRALRIDEAFLRSGGGKCETAVPGVLSRYVTVFSPRDTALHLSALEVYGVAVDNSH